MSKGTRQCWCVLTLPLAKPSYLCDSGQVGNLSSGVLLGAVQNALQVCVRLLQLIQLLALAARTHTQQFRHHADTCAAFSTHKHGLPKCRLLLPLGSR